jgi:hypothetical protein
MCTNQMLSPPLLDVHPKPRAWGSRSNSQGERHIGDCMVLATSKKSQRQPFTCWPRLFMLLLAMLTPHIASAEIQIDRVVHGSGTGFETGELIVHFSDGTVDSTPYSISVWSNFAYVLGPGSIFLPPIDLQAELISHGGGWCDPETGLCYEPQFAPQDDKEDFGPLSADQTAGAGGVIGIAAACAAGIAITHAACHFTCRNNGGVRSLTYGLCGVLGRCVCWEPRAPTPVPPPPPPPTPNPNLMNWFDQFDYGPFIVRPPSGQ